MKTKRTKKLSHPNLTKLYICALSAVAILCIVGQILIQNSLDASLKDAYIINMAGRQRMLSQKLNKLILLMDRNQRNANQPYLKELKQTLDLFNDFHNGLYRRDEKLLLEGKNSEEIIKLFESLDPYFKEMTKNIQIIIKGASAGEDRPVDEILFNKVLSNEANFLNLMNAIVKQYEIEARENVERIKRIEMTLFICTLLVLFFEGFFIFRPAVLYIKEVNEDLELKIRERTEEIHSKNEELMAQNDEMVRLNKDLDNFIYTASHDLKAPISNIDGLIKVLSSEVTHSSKSKELIEMMKESINHFNNTIKELSDTGKAKMEALGQTKAIKFQEVLEEVMFTIRELIQKAEATIIQDFSLVDQINFSHKNIRSILYNLISNAVKYKSPDRKPVIKVTTEKQDDFIVLKVIDNGTGIKKEDIPKIFSMYTRLEKNVEGTGVGLSIVKRIMDNSGGRIEVESELGEGCTFKVYFKKT